MSKTKSRVCKFTSPAEALNRGYTYATIAPRGHIVSYHLDEKLAKRHLRYYLQGLGCTIALVASLIAPIASAHDEWANGKPVPDWVKSSCCGAADAHHLTPDMVHDMGNYYIVDGYNLPVRKTLKDGSPNTSILPSQDGEYWIFYSSQAAGKNCSPEAGCQGWHDASQTGVYCFFIPMSI